MTVIETSKELLRCADWMVCRNGMADYEPTMEDFLKWSAMIRSLVIPSPLGSDGERNYTDEQLAEARRYTEDDYQEVKRGLYPIGSNDETEKD